MTCGGGGGMPTMMGAPLRKSDAEIRQEICDKCEYSRDDVCQIVELKHPGRARISHGVVRPMLRCPLEKPKWTEARSTCVGCGRQRQIITLKTGVCFLCANQRELDRRNSVARHGKRSSQKAEKSTRLKPTRFDWSVGITTAPRKDCTLIKCVESVRSAGWEPVVFAEPGSTETDCKTITNDKRLGVWHNWLSSARWLIDHTDSNLIMTVQDDSIFHPDSRSFAESILWPTHTTGYLSLYTPKHYSAQHGHNPGVHRVFTGSLWGACALIFDRDVLRKVVDSPIAQTWQGVAPASGDPRVMQRRYDQPETIANSDTAIGQIIASLGLSTYYITPSPVSHISEHSTIAHGGNRGRRNCFVCADHSRPLAEQVL